MDKAVYVSDDVVFIYMLLFFFCQKYLVSLQDYLVFIVYYLQVVLPFSGPSHSFCALEYAKPKSVLWCVLKPLMCQHIYLLKFL